jgi:hypothetical protein
VMSASLGAGAANAANTDFGHCQRTRSALTVVWTVNPDLVSRSATRSAFAAFPPLYPAYVEPRGKSESIIQPVAT